MAKSPQSSARTRTRAGASGPPVRGQRVLVTDVWPLVAHGTRPVKAVVGEAVDVSASVFRDGHDSVAATLLLRSPTGITTSTPMRPGVGIDRWVGSIRPEVEGAWTYTIEAWTDPISTWRRRAAIKVPADIDVESELEAGALLFDRAAVALTGPEAKAATSAAAMIRDATRAADLRLAAASNPVLMDALARTPLREHLSSYGPFELQVDRRRALVGSWYEFFPRSEGATVTEKGAPVSGTLRTAAARLSAIAEMGFDVVYLPPIHPIGTTFRKGPNNSVVAGPGDPGSPWAIGSSEGGHDAIHPDLGTLDDFDAFVNVAASLDLEVALDLALQCSPDHPWVTAHPQWFAHRADGTIAYAENPPKKYQDIYPLSFDTDPDGLYAEILRIVRHWMAHGVRIFRVDNPHTKPVPFWERLIAEVNHTDPDVLFLAEAFTVPHMMKELAEIGFHQSYTYFTWRNTKDEVLSYAYELTELSSPYMRPNAFTNTPDILHEYLQAGGAPAFRIRATLAATLYPTYGIYSGFELYERVAVAAGSEEYLDSEKYQYRVRDWTAAAEGGHTLSDYLMMLNQARREHPALQTLRGLHMHRVDDDSLICFSRRDGDDCIVVVCSLDPHSPRESLVHLDLGALGVDDSDTFVAHDLVSSATWQWGAQNFVRLDPANEIAHIIQVRTRRP